jgi:hypothetical protein
VLGRHQGSDIVLTLPPEIEIADLKWISVWCRRFSVNFGDLVLDDAEDDAEEKEDESTESPFDQIEDGFTISATSRPRPPPPTRLPSTQRFSTRRPLSPFLTSRRPPPAVFRPAVTSLMTSRTVPPRFIPERPRSVVSSSRNSLQGFGKGGSKSDKRKHSFTVTDAESGVITGSDPIPFTVIRVSSSVSQVRPEVQVGSDDGLETTVVTSAKPETTERTPFKFSREPQKKFSG